MATHSSVLPWEIPWTESLVGFGPWGRKELDTTERLSTQQGCNVSVVKLFIGIFPQLSLLILDNSPLQ